MRSLSLQVLVAGFDVYIVFQTAPARVDLDVTREDALSLFKIHLRNDGDGSLDRVERITIKLHNTFSRTRPVRIMFAKEGIVWHIAGKQSFLADVDGMPIGKLRL
jgi:hypothetical protein